MKKGSQKTNTKVSITLQKLHTLSMIAISSLGYTDVKKISSKAISSKKLAKLFAKKSTFATISKTSAGLKKTIISANAKWDKSIAAIITKNKSGKVITYFDKSLKHTKSKKSSSILLSKSKNSTTAKIVTSSKKDASTFKTKFTGGHTAETKVKSSHMKLLTPMSKGSTLRIATRA